MQKSRRDAVRNAAFVFAMAFANVNAAGAQTGAAAPAPRTVVVEGRAMRVWAAGLEQRRLGQPMVILEAGAGEGLENWRPAFGEIARVAPVIAYDRRGVGQSEPDSVKPTLRRVAQSLHALLQQISAPPPYVLVGHSWGGLFVRAFADQYATEVAGLVLLDVTDFETTPQEKGAAVPESERERVMSPPTMPPIPPDTPPGLRAEFEIVTAEMTNDYPEARSLRRWPSGVPVAVVVATPASRLQSVGGAMVRLQMKHQAEWAMTSSRGVFVAASHVGHMVHRDDPALVVRLVEHVISNRTQPPTIRPAGPN